MDPGHQTVHEYPTTHINKNIENIGAKKFDKECSVSGEQIEEAVYVV